jgi:hypothetical protein
MQQVPHCHLQTHQSVCCYLCGEGLCNACPGKPCCLCSHSNAMNSLSSQWPTPESVGGRVVLEGSNVKPFFRPLQHPASCCCRCTCATAASITSTTRAARVLDYNPSSPSLLLQVWLPPAHPTLSSTLHPTPTALLASLGLVQLAETDQGSACGRLQPGLYSLALSTTSARHATFGTQRRQPLGSRCACG